MKIPFFNFFVSKKNKLFKNATYFCTQFPDAIGLYYKDYLALRSQLPFHSVVLEGRFAFIELMCPFNNTFAYKKFYHFGERLDFNDINFSFKNSDIPDYIKGHNSNVEKDGDVPLPANFNFCSLCKRELECTFSLESLSYTPKIFDLLYFISILKEKGYTESDAMKQYFEATQSDEYSFINDDFAPTTWFDYLVVYGVFFSLMILYFPVTIIIGIVSFLKKQIRKITN